MHFYGPAQINGDPARVTDNNELNILVRNDLELLVRRDCEAWLMHRDDGITRLHACNQSVAKSVVPRLKTILLQTATRVKVAEFSAVETCTSEDNTRLMFIGVIQVVSCRPRPRSWEKLHSCTRNYLQLPLGSRRFQV